MPRYERHTQALYLICENMMKHDVTNPVRKVTFQNCITVS